MNYIDVGQGDSILICLPDEKNMLIDCGDGSDFAVGNIIKALNDREISTLDYLVLTHPDFDHIGGVTKVLKDISVTTVYHPDIPEGKEGFSEYFSVVDFLTEKGAQNKISLFGEVLGEKYKVAFLSPKPRQIQGSSYRDFYLSLVPTDMQVNDLSPYVYLEYMGVRFLFTGDCGKNQEKALLSDYEFIKQTFSRKGVNLNLEDIDFLKVAHHGSNDCSSYAFLSMLRPKTAIISVGGNNIYGHPASSVLMNLKELSPNYQLKRTDVDGSVSVFVDTEGNIEVKTCN